MFTLHHGFWMFLISRGHYQMWQFVLGSMLPDYEYFLMLGLMILQDKLGIWQALELSPEQFGSFIPLFPWVQQADLILHSVIYWGLAFIIVLLPWFNQGQAFVVGWGTHLLVDTFTHGAIANFYLYPLSMEQVRGPVSYWEPEYYAHEYRIVHTTLLAAAIIYVVVSWLKKKYIK